MSDGIVPFERLQRLCVPEGPLPRASTVRRWADQNGIRYKPDRNNGIWTTVDALNAALGLAAAADTRPKMEDLI